MTEFAGPVLDSIESLDWIFTTNSTSDNAIEHLTIHTTNHHNHHRKALPCQAPTHHG